MWQSHLNRFHSHSRTFPGQTQNPAKLGVNKHTRRGERQARHSQGVSLALTLNRLNSLIRPQNISHTLPYRTIQHAWYPPFLVGAVLTSIPADLSPLSMPHTAGMSEYNMFRAITIIGSLLRFLEGENLARKKKKDVWTTPKFYHQVYLPMDITHWMKYFIVANLNSRLTSNWNTVAWYWTGLEESWILQRRMGNNFSTVILVIAGVIAHPNSASKGGTTWF